jgi:chorismate mutase
LDDLEALPPEFKVLGINDYIFIDGYRRLLAEKKTGRLQNIDLLLPVIELRLDKFGGTASKLSRVNFHVIFSDALDPDVIEQQFLNALPRHYRVSPQYEEEGQRWSALATRQSIEDLGRMIIDSVPASERAKFGAPLQEGFNSFCVSLDGIEEALRSHYFEGKVITAVGKTEWADIKWNDHSIAEKKNTINAADLVFTSSPSPEHWANAKAALSTAAVNDRLLDCSDAHSYSKSTEKDRIGNCFTWIKADPTFAGLLQVLNEPDDRVFVGHIPPKLERVRADKTRYIREITIKKKLGASLSETWFDNEISLNSALVAIIGNKGKGKSALADTVGLLGNTRQHRAFSFLSPDSFKNPRDNKARFFEATLKWESGNQEKAMLDHDVDETQPELVRYIPQNFLETICTEIAGESETSFDKELKKVIFSHVAEADRLKYAALDDLIAFRTEEAASRMAALRSESHPINERIAAMEIENTLGYRKSIESRLKLKREEIDAHGKTKPSPVPAPTQASGSNNGGKNLSATIEDLLAQRTKIDEEIATAKVKQAEYAIVSATIEKARSKLLTIKQQAALSIRELTSDCSRLGLSVADLITFTINEQPLITKESETTQARSQVDALLNPTNPSSAVARRAEVTASITEIQDQLDEPNRLYQAYLRALEEWERREQALIGDESAIGSLKFIEKQLADLNELPTRLAAEEEARLEKAKAIHGEITNLSAVYRTLYAPVQGFIDTNPIAREKFHLNFEVAFSLSGFEDKFSSFINRAAIGTFSGIEEGSKALRDIMRRHDLGDESGAVAFLNEVIDGLHHDKRTTPAVTVSAAAQLRKGQSIIDVYDYVFSLEYLKPRYRLRMGQKELNQLSPGERGTLLLVFYLLIDKEQIPLIIDQPEENLDNQTVFELLVPCIKETKQRRQVIIVTHNPNLAVVCDAEQIVCASLDKAGNHRMEYVTGAIENPRINAAIMDILEGTRPAFDNRNSKYEVSAQME